MSFATPLFLIGLAAIAIPIIIHLSRRRTAKTIDFPSLMFLGKVPYRSLRRRRLRDQLLLAARCLALAALALAFARPIFQQDAAAATSDRRDLVVLVDRSFSMEYGDRWEAARDAVRGIADSLEADDSVTLVGFDEGAEVLVPPTGDVARVTTALDALEPTARVTRYGPALKVARAQLIESDAGHREVIMVGDLQRAEVGAADELRLPPGVEFRILDVSESESGVPVNYALTEVTLDRARAAADNRQELTVGVRLLRLGGEVPTDGAGTEETPEQVTLELLLDQRSVERRTLDVTDASQTVSFAPVNLESGVLTRGEIRLLDDRLAADNTLAFTVSPADSLPLLLVTADQSQRSHSLYVERALDTARRPRFRIDRQQASEVTPGDVQRVRVVILLDSASEIGGPTRQAIRDLVDGGGGLLLVSGRQDSGGWSQLHLNGGEPMEQHLEGRALAYLDYDHPVFEPFARASSGDFSGVRFFRYRRFPDVAGASTDQEASTVGGGEGPTSVGHTVIARFDDGSPALFEIERGRGHILVWTSTLDAEWNDLALQPVFVPWLDAAVRYVAGHQPAREAYTVSQLARLELPASQEREWLITSPSGEKATRQTEGELILPLEESGFYQLRPVRAEDRGPSGSEIELAVNVDPLESDLGKLDREELEAAIGGSPLEVVSAEDPDQAVARERDRQHWWWFVLLAALIVLVSESLLSNRGTGERRRTAAVAR